MIYYFSGTGNSKYTAQRIASADNDAILFAPDVITGRAIVPLEAKTDTLGFVFPTYFFGLPIIVEDLLEALELTEVHGRYVYLVMTCGSSTGNASRLFEKLLRKRGCELSACFGVRMVDNYVPGFRIGDDAAIRRKLDDANANIKDICEKIHNRETGDFDDCKGGSAALMTSMSYPIYINGRKTKNFKVSKACVSCGKCAKGCPVSAIAIEDGRPEWKTDRCVLCLRCLHSCPAQAIDYGRKTKGRGRYKNPNISM